MRVRDLIEYLEEFDPELDVHIQYNYGDYWRTQVAPKANSVEQIPIEWSEYHRMPKIREIDEDDEEAYNNRREVVVIG